MPVEIAIPIAIFLVFLNGFFVAAEFSLVKIRHTRLTELAAKGGGAAKMALHAANHLDAYLAATQLGITIASIGLGWIGEPAFAILLDPFFVAFEIPDNIAHGIAFGVAFATISMLHIVLGELAPKSWAIQNPEKLALMVAYPLHWFFVVFRPAIWFFNGLANMILRLFKIQPAGEHEMAHSQEELSMILTASGESGAIKKSEVDLMQHVFLFGEKDVGDIMVPRPDIVMLHRDWDLDKAVEVSLEHAYSRYPLTEGGFDQIVGMVHIRDVLAHDRQGGSSLEEIKREILVVPETKGLDGLLKDFQRARTHMALVVDEYGGTRGIVTLEDVLEQIVGRIDDETDEDVVAIERVDERTWNVLAKVHLDELNAAVGSNFPSDKYGTLGGFASGLRGRQMKVGEKVRFASWEISVLEMDGRRLTKLAVRSPQTMRP